MLNSFKIAEHFKLEPIFLQQLSQCKPKKFHLYSLVNNFPSINVCKSFLIFNTCRKKVIQCKSVRNHVESQTYNIRERNKKTSNFTQSNKAFYCLAELLSAAHKSN